jgi:hypothetical protein
MLLSLSDIGQSFPASWLRFSPNPSVEYVDHVQSGLTRLGVIQRGDRRFRGICNVPRYFFPQADEEGLVVSLELMCWYFYFDDPIDDGRLAGAPLLNATARMIDVLYSGGLPPNPTPTEWLCWQFRERSRVLSGKRVRPWRRFLAACADWVRSIVPTNRRMREGLPTLAEYDELRLQNVGIIPEYALNEIVAGLALREDFVALPEVVELGRLSALVIAYCNDVYSYEREARRRTQLNSLELRRTHGKLALSPAYAAQVSDIRQMVARFLTIERDLVGRSVLGLSALGDDAVAARNRREQTRYVEYMKAIMVGNHMWSVNDGRYRSANSPFEELRPPLPVRVRRRSRPRLSMLGG